MTAQWPLRETRTSNQNIGMISFSPSEVVKKRNIIISCAFIVHKVNSPTCTPSYWGMYLALRLEMWILVTSELSCYYIPSAYKPKKGEEGMQHCKRAKFKHGLKIEMWYQLMLSMSHIPVICACTCAIPACICIQCILAYPNRFRQRGKIRVKRWDN